MVSFAAKFKHTFVPRQIGSVYIKSQMTVPADYGSMMKKNMETWDSSATTSDESLDTKELDTYEIDHEHEDQKYIPPLDRFIMLIVDAAGSVYGFALACMILIIWIVLGAVYKAPDNWQIIMQDGQSIQCYVWDTLLMRQQIDDSNNLLILNGRMKSRLATHKRIINNLHTKSIKEFHIDEKYNDIESLIKLKSEDLFSRFSSAIAHILGSLPSVFIYWAGVFTWVGCGALYTSAGNDPPFTGERTGSNPEYSRFTDVWQMYINTAVAVVLLVTSVLLENVRCRNDGFICSQIEEIGILDCKLEATGRYLTGDTIENKTIEVSSCKRNSFGKVITFYADIIGTGLGLLISIAVFAAWIAVGHLMQWNSNWWLIIGTYTGLIGFIDGFVLREVYQSLTEHEEAKFDELLSESQELLDLAGINYQLKQPIVKETLGYKLSQFNNVICSSQWSVVLSIVVVVALICVASGLRWSVTGQLICNTPTMIIEGFSMLILIQAHGWADYKRRFIVKELAISRELLLQYYQTKDPIQNVTAMQL